MITLTPIPNKHPHGYLPKIAYHLAAGNEEKVNYFTQRQIEVYGPLTPENLSFISNEVNSIKRTWAQEEAEFNSHLNYI